jgi:hypothetical protein
VTTKRLIPVLFVTCGLAPPAALALAAGDADRFARLADGARASGTLEMTLKFSGAQETCGTHHTCGRSGTIVTKLPLDTTKAARLRGSDLVVLGVKGTTQATVRDTVAGHVCHGTARVSTTGIKYAGDANGVLLRVGVPPAADPFETACKGPTLAGLGETALPTVRIPGVKVGVNHLSFKVRATRLTLGGGYEGRLSARGTVSLHG